MSNDQKNMTGNIVGIIIMFLALFSILCDLFKTDVNAFISLSELIKDANAFVTVICVVYIIVIFRKLNGSYKTVLIFAVDILLINRLYSNTKWKMIYGKIKDVNVKDVNIKKIILIAIIIAIIVAIFYGIFINKFNSKKQKNDYLFKEQKQFSNLEHEEKKQKLVENVNSLSEDDDLGGFRISAFISLALIALLFLYSKELNIAMVNGKILSAITDNLFTFVFGFLIFFMIFQIVCIIFLNILSGNKINKEIGNEFNACIERVEKKMVKIACNIIEGCISLLDFVPDFFSTIGLLLLDEEIDLDKKDKKDK